MSDDCHAFPQGPDSNDSAAPGMTLRDYFAAHVLCGMMAYPGQEGRGSFHSNCTTDQAAKEAYIMADAMLKARKATVLS